LSDRPIMNKAARHARLVTSPSNLVSTRDLLVFWGIVVATFAVLIKTDFHWAAIVLAFFAIAKAQGGLLLSGHEASHHMLLRHRVANDLVGQWLCNAPMGVGFHTARSAHLDHHRYLLSERDVKLDQQLERPSRRAYLWHMSLPLFGTYLARGVVGFFRRAPRKRARPTYTVDPARLRSDRISILVSSLVFFALCALIDWRLYLFWIVPLLTVSAFFHNAKGFLDHAKLPDEPDQLLYTYKVTWVDRIFFGVQQARHAEHHLFPHVPYHRLSELHPLVTQLAGVRCRDGYFGFLVEYYKLANRFPSASQESP
jgi:fatty acid desaturase